MDDLMYLKECMTDAGCSEASVQRAERLCQNGRTEDLLLFLRSCRCDVLEEIHEKQKRLDRLDKLIRETGNM